MSLGMSIRGSERIQGFRVFTETNYKDQTVKTVFIDYVMVAKFVEENVNEKKLAAIELYERCGCSMETAGLICNFHRNTVSQLVKTKNLLGIEAVFEDNRGLKSPYKYVTRIQNHIESLLERYPQWPDQTIADEAAKCLNMNISRSAVARIRTGNVDTNPNKLSRKEIIDLYQEADAIDRSQYSGKQMLLEFEWDQELKEKSKEFSSEPAPEVEKDTEKQIVKRLQHGERCCVSGNLMHHLFLQEIRFNELAAVYHPEINSTYQPADILLTIFHSINLGIGSIEGLKLVNAAEFGVFAGMNRIADKETIRDHLTQMAHHYLSQDLIDEFAHRLLQNRFIDPEVFFIDGHFLPYYGLNVIAKGYFTVRRLAMRGNELYAITDLQGRPLFFITETNEIDFRPMISRSADKLIEYGVERPLLVFDRGGYGIHFFSRLVEKADFITWSKYMTNEYLESFDDESFTVGFRFSDHKYEVAERIKTVSESAQTAQKEGRSKLTSVQLRVVVLKNVDTGKRIGIFTSDRNKPLHMIALYMVHRWGDSENFFKEMMDRFNLNYHPGYDIAELEKQPLIDNPDIALTRKAIGILKKEIKKIDEEILITEAKLNRRNDKRSVEKLSQLPVVRQEKQEDLTNFKSKLETLPDKVAVTDLLRGKPMNRCDLEKKRIYDFLQFLSFLSRERLVEIFKQCYDDHRDVKKVLDMITCRPGYLKLVGQTLIVILDWIENEKHRTAAEQLCKLLNDMNIVAAGRLKVRIFFRISAVPHHGSPKFSDKFDLCTI